MNPSNKVGHTQKIETVFSSPESPSRPKIKYEYRGHHALFKWAIDNFPDPSLINKRFFSPAFELKETSWCMALLPKANNSGFKTIELNMFRSLNDTGPNAVQATYRLGFESAGNKVWFKVEEKKNFSKETNYGFEISVLEHLEDFRKEAIENKDNTLFVLCEIYIKYKLRIISSFIKECDVDSNLPMDLLNIFENRHFADVLIETPTGRFKVHKAVLCARSRIIAGMLKHKSVLQFDCTWSCMRFALLYMYTGSFTYLARYADFSIGLYEFVRKLSLTKLCDFLTPQIIEVKSRIIVDECTIECALNGFQLSDIVGESRKTGTFIDDKTKMGVKFCFRKLDDSSDDVECRIGLSGLAQAMSFLFRLSLLNTDRDPVELIPANFTPDTINRELKDSIYYYTLTFKDDDVLRCSTNGILYLTFHCVRYTLKHWIQPDATETLFKKPLALLRDTGDWMDDLSKDMYLLYENGNFSDITLESMGRRFSAHRCILAARSGYFRKLIKHSRLTNQAIQVVNIDAFTLGLLLTYIYCGTLGETDDLTGEDFLELLEIAHQYEIKSLLKECEDFLAVNLKDDFAFQVLIAAEKCKNNYLKNLCTNYINTLEQVSSSDSSEESTED